MLENKRVMRGNIVTINYLWANPVLKSCYLPSGKCSVRHWLLCQADNPKLFMANSTKNLSHRKPDFRDNNQQHLIHLNLPIIVLVLWALRKSIHRAALKE